MCIVYGFASQANIEFVSRLEWTVKYRAEYLNGKAFFCFGYDYIKLLDWHFFGFEKFFDENMMGAMIFIPKATILRWMMGAAALFCSSSYFYLYLNVPRGKITSEGSHGMSSTV